MTIGKPYLLAVLLALGGCGIEGERQQTDNPDVDVKMLFEHRGCTVYRFWDVGRPVWYADCGGGSRTGWTESCGKNCTRHMGVPTGQ